MLERRNDLSVLDMGKLLRYARSRRITSPTPTISTSLTSRDRYHKTSPNSPAANTIITQPAASCENFLRRLARHVLVEQPRGHDPGGVGQQGDRKRH